jgi:hypothetical protein
MNKAYYVEVTIIGDQPMARVARTAQPDKLRTYRGLSRYSIGRLAHVIHVERWIVRPFLAGAVGWIARRREG